MDNRTADRDFLRAAGRQWSIVRWARAQEQLTGTGSASFRLARGGNLTIGPTRIELSYGKLPRSIEVANVERAAVENGALLIFEPSAKAVRLPLRDVADAEVVVRALTEVARLKFARDRS